MEGNEMSDAVEVEIVTKLPEQTFAMRSPQVQKLVTLHNLWEVHGRLKGELMRSTRMEIANAGKLFCGFMQGKEFSPDMMQRWFLHLKDDHRGPNGEKVSAYYCNKINYRVRTFLKWLRLMGYLTEDFGPCIPSLKCNAIKEAQIITEEEFERIKAYCKTKLHFQPHLWLCILSYRTGMSLIDCCYLRWRDIHIDFNGPSYIKIHRIKTARFGAGAACHIPLIPGTDVWQWLKFLSKAARYKRHDQIDDYVHQDTTGLYECTWQRIQQDFKAIFRFAKVGSNGDKTFKHFRNSFCSNLVNSEVQLALVCKMTGHKNLKTLLRYLQPDMKALADGLNKAFHFAAAQAGHADSSASVPTFEPTTIDDTNATTNEQRSDQPDKPDDEPTGESTIPRDWPVVPAGNAIQGHVPENSNGGSPERNQQGVVGTTPETP